jgi:hypothetical protein
MAHRLNYRQASRRDQHGVLKPHRGAGWWWVLVLGLVAGLLLYLFPQL